MKRRMYQLRDVVAGCLVGPILLERNDAPAVRSFYMAFEDPKSTLGQHPEDYELLCLGEYDDEVGVTEPGVALIATGIDWVKLQARKAEDAAE